MNFLHWLLRLGGFTGADSVEHSAPRAGARRPTTETTEANEPSELGNRPEPGNRPELSKTAQIAEPASERLAAAPDQTETPPPGVADAQFVDVTVQGPDAEGRLRVGGAIVGGRADEFTLTANWGDGAVEEFHVRPSQFRLNHLYNPMSAPAAARPPRIRLTLVDDELDMAVDAVDVGTQSPLSTPGAGGDAAPVDYALHGVDWGDGDERLQLPVIVFGAGVSAEGVDGEERFTLAQFAAPSPAENAEPGDGFLLWVDALSCDAEACPHGETKSPDGRPGPRFDPAVLTAGDLRSRFGTAICAAVAAPTATLAETHQFACKTPAGASPADWRQLRWRQLPR